MMHKRTKDGSNSNSSSLVSALERAIFARDMFSRVHLQLDSNSI